MQKFFWLSEFFGYFAIAIGQYLTKLS